MLMISFRHKKGQILVGRRCSGVNSINWQPLTNPITSILQYITAITAVQEKLPISIRLSVLSETTWLSLPAKTKFSDVGISHMNSTALLGLPKFLADGLSE